MPENYISEQAKSSKNHDKPYIPAEVTRLDTKWPRCRWYAQDLRDTHCRTFEASLLTTWQLHVDRLLSAAECLGDNLSLDVNQSDAIGGVIDGLRRQSVDLEEIIDLINYLTGERKSEPVMPSPTPETDERQAQCAQVTYGRDDLPYPVPKGLNKDSYWSSDFGKIWKRNRPPWLDEAYVDPQTGKPNWDRPFFMGMACPWFAYTDVLLKKLAQEINSTDETDSLMLSVRRAFDDFHEIWDFADDTWEYDPKIRAAFLGESSVSAEEGGA